MASGQRKTLEKLYKYPNSYSFRLARNGVYDGGQNGDHCSLSNHLFVCKRSFPNGSETAGYGNGDDGSQSWIYGGSIFSRYPGRVKSLICDICLTMIGK